ncbi:hypothetical protein [Streptomyces sp. NPDC050504]|uniref:hypothetical protein n=1 Tax=Streptomyces sp. NPDC050504 TaxID=3365618 RepID=UPI0037B507F2
MTNQAIRRSIAALTLTGATVATGLVLPSAAQAAGCASPKLTGLSAPTPFEGGKTVVFRAALDCAPRAETWVALKSTSAAVEAPARIRFKAGRSVVTFTVPTALVKAPVDATVKGTLRSSSRTTPVRLLPQCATPRVVAVSLKATAAYSGDRIPGAVRLACAPSRGPITVSLSSAPMTSVLTPKAVVVPVGSKYGYFTAVAGEVRDLRDAELTARTPGTPGKPDSLVTTRLAISPGLMHFGGADEVVGGRAFKIRASLTGTAPANGTKVALRSSSPLVKVPAAVTVSQGNTDATVSVETLPVERETTVTVTGTLGTVTESFRIVLHPQAFDPGAWSLDGSYGLLVGESAEYRVAISNPAPAGGLKVALREERGVSWVHVPAQVVIPGGAKSATFSVTVDPNAKTGRHDGPVITAAVPGGGERTIQPSILPRLLSVTGAPAVVEGGKSFDLTATYTSGSERGLSLNVTSSGSAARVPAADEWGTVNDRGEDGTFTFSVATEVVAVDTRVNLLITYPGKTVVVPLLVKAPVA